MNSLGETLPSLNYNLKGSLREHLRFNVPCELVPCE